jgi:hypothetical protein
MKITTITAIVGVTAIVAGAAFALPVFYFKHQTAAVTETQG